MQKIIKTTYYVFLSILVATAMISLLGISYVWFWKDAPQDLPHLEWLLGIVIAEVVGVVIMVAKRGLKYLPDVTIDKNEKDTLDFMAKFTSFGTSVVIVSNRVSWLGRGDKLLEELNKKAQSGTHIEIITPSIVQDKVRLPLENAGVKFYVTKERNPPESRFTLINSDRSGAEKLAIAKGVHPDHEITVFDMNSGPQIIAMAKDIVRKSKDICDASSME